MAWRYATSDVTEEIETGALSLMVSSSFPSAAQRCTSDAADLCSDSRSFRGVRRPIAQGAPDAHELRENLSRFEPGKVEGPCSRASGFGPSASLFTAARQPRGAARRAKGVPARSTRGRVL